MTITITPPNPTTNDAVTISVEYFPCGVIGHSIAQSGFNFTVTLVYNGGGCGTVPVRTTDFLVGKLAPGTYTVTQANPNIPGTASFAVIQSTASTIPAVEPLGLVLVATAILLLAIPRLFRG